MYQIKQINDSPLQRQTLVLPDGTSFTMTIYYMLQQYAWFIRSLTYGEDFTLNGFKISNSPNMLHQFKNQIPFGIACFTKGNREPTQKEDFSSLTSVLYVLSEAEVEAYSEYLSGQVS